MGNLLGRIDLLTAKQVCGLLPTKKHPQTVLNWATKGLRGVFLKSTVVLGERLFTADDVEAFLQEASTKPFREMQQAKEAGERRVAFERNCRKLTPDENRRWLTTRELPDDCPPPPLAAPEQAQS